MFQEKTFFQKTAIGKMMVVKMSQHSDIIKTEWGYIDSDKWQEVEEKITSIFESTSAHKTAEENAATVLERYAKKRIESGYYTSQEEAENASLTFDFDNLPKSFSPNKPVVAKPCLDKNDPIKCDLPNKAISILIKEKRFWAQRKANGCRCFYVKSDKNSYLFSRKIKDVSKNFIGIKEEFDKLDIPPFSIVDFEAVIAGGDTKRQCDIISSMSPNTKPERAQGIYDKWMSEHSENDGIGAIVFDILFWNSEATVYGAYKDRYALIEKICPFTDTERDKSKNKIVRPYNYTYFHEATTLMKENLWEGLVIWDNELHSDYCLNGKPRRPSGCYKWKNTKTADCFVIDLIPQEGNTSLVGSLNVGQFDESGAIIDCGNVGSGLNPDTRKEAWNWKDKVIVVEYNERMKPNDEGQICFQFPRICVDEDKKPIRSDKTKEECIFEEDEQ